MTNLPVIETWEQYTQEVKRTMKPIHPQGEVCMGLTGEVGEMMGAFKAYEYHGGNLLTLDRYNLEAGDAWWYFTAQAVLLGLMPDEIERIKHVLTNTDVAPNYTAPRHEDHLLELMRDAVALQQTIRSDDSRYLRGRIITLMCSVAHGLIKACDTAPRFLWMKNRDKLRKRFPHGFTDEASKARADKDAP